MGRIKTIRMKRIARKLFSDYEKDMSQDFGKAKLAVNEFTDVSSKKLRNVIAGYIVRLVKQKALNKMPGRYVKEEDLSKFYN